MSDIKGLVKRLRDRREYQSRGHGEVVDVADGDCEEAADALEAMAANRDLWRDKCVLMEAERDRLKAAVSLFVNAYTKAHPMRRADFHSPGCVCIRCAFDAAHKALGGDAS